MGLRSVLVEIHGAPLDAAIDHALIGGLALAAHGAARATAYLDLLAEGERAADVDLILRGRDYERLLLSENVGNYASADPARGRVDFLFARREGHLDLADIQRLLRSASVDLVRVRAYFRLFDREKELDALLAEERER
jgi:hypothetical protein